ncbi:Morn repeat protein [Pandoravirus kuranda]|uniref:Morn repeat protein n=2 Tax=Pandoravirus TaxID=2060084 RepID=A0AA95ECI5_9VIRU|nr:Morn repeat domain containing protein [Pandoravirus neocaledonia]AVK75665.1 Morn repeat domain containing protein [Pandoravirus neocaledonia]WBR14227.1 Morn repeat protein [Pandoravirus kuranda]
MQEQRRRARPRKRTRDKRRRRDAVGSSCGASSRMDVPVQPTHEYERTGLLRLPDELLLMIMAHGSVGVVGRLACTCRLLAGLARDDNLWKGLCVQKDDPDMEHFVPHPHWNWRWLYRAHIFHSCVTPALALGSSWYDRHEAGTYAGEWANGLPHGYGRITECTDWGLFTRQGYWRNGRLHGHSIVHRDYQEICRGEFRRDKMHGAVRFTDEWGVVYEGEARRGKMHGMGTARYVDGGHYHGQFRRDMRHGQGTLTWPDGRTETGRWEQDAIVAETVVHGHVGAVATPQD